MACFFCVVQSKSRTLLDQTESLAIDTRFKVSKQLQKFYSFFCYQYDIIVFSLCFSVTNGSSHMDEVEDGELYRRGSDLHSSSLHSYLQDRWVLGEAFL